MFDRLQVSRRLIVSDFNESTFSESEEEISYFLAGDDRIRDFDYDNGDISLHED